MNDINENFSFKFVDWDQVLKEIKKFDGNKASQINDIPNKNMTETLIWHDIFPHNFNNSLFDLEFPGKLKEADITPVYKRKRNI